MRSRVGPSSYSEGESKGERPIIHSIAHEAKYLKGCNLTVDQVKAFILFLERYRNNREYSIGGVRSYIDEAATKMITLKLRHTVTGAELLRHADWTKSDGWLEWDAGDIIKGLREAFVRSADQQFAEIDELWEKFIEKLEKEAIANPNNLTSSIEEHLVRTIIEFKSNHADPSEEKAADCLSRGERLLTNKKNPRRYEATPKRFQADLDKKLRMVDYVQNKSWDSLIACYYDVMVDWEKKAHELKEKGYSMTTSTSRDSSRDKKGGNKDKVDKPNYRLDGYNVGYTPCFHCGKNHSPSVCQLINHPEANQKGEWIASASYKKCKDMFLKDTQRKSNFPTLPMWKNTSGETVSYELTNKSARDESKSSGNKRVSFSGSDDKDSTRSDFSKRRRHDGDKKFGAGHKDEG